jgi:hypothetical protein
VFRWITDLHHVTHLKAQIVRRHDNPLAAGILPATLTTANLLQLFATITERRCASGELGP